MPCLVVDLRETKTRFFPLSLQLIFTFYSLVKANVACLITASSQFRANLWVIMRRPLLWSHLHVIHTLNVEFFNLTSCSSLGYIFILWKMISTGWKRKFQWKRQSTFLGDVWADWCINFRNDFFIKIQFKRLIFVPFFSRLFCTWNN